MKNMDPATLRRSNPQMAAMSDEQIRASVQQMEMMADNPAMMKMAAEQMSSMTPDQIKQQMDMMKVGRRASVDWPRHRIGLGLGLRSSSSSRACARETRGPSARRGEAREEARAC